MEIRYKWGENTFTSMVTMIWVPTLLYQEGEKSMYLPVEKLFAVESGHCTLMRTVSNAVLVNVTKKIRVTSEAFRSSKEW